MKGRNTMFRFAYANQNNAMNASAACAEAASCCASQSSSRFVMMDAMIMASIIIFVLCLSRLSLPVLVLGIFILLLVEFSRAEQKR